MVHSKRISHRERVYVRVITISTMLKGEKVTKKVLRQTLLDVNKGDISAVKIYKISTASSTRNNCHAFPSNNGMFVPWRIKSYVSRQLLSESLVEQLLKSVDNKELAIEKKNLGEPLSDSNASIWYMDMSDATLQTVSTLLCNEYMRIVRVTGRAADSNLLDGVIEVFEYFVMKKKVPSVITYLKYEPNEVQGTSEHRDVDSILCITLPILKDTSTGRLHIRNANLPEFF